MAAESIDKILGKGTAETTAQSVAKSITSGKGGSIQNKANEIGKKIRNAISDTFGNTTYNAKYDKNGYIIKYPSKGLKYEKGR